MKRLISCRFNMDTACVELKFSDGSRLAIDTIAAPLEYAQLVLGGGLEEYLNGTPEHRLMD